MLVSPTREQLTDLAGLVEQSRWTKVDQLIQAEIDALVDRMVHSRDTAELHEFRGSVKALKEFQSTAREASKALEKMGAPRPSL